MTSYEVYKALGGGKTIRAYAFDDARKTITITRSESTSVILISSESFRISDRLADSDTADMQFILGYLKALEALRFDFEADE